MKRSGSGISLIEVLVVMAVISTLVAILLPSLHGARVFSQRLRCATHLKQITFALHAYLDDWDGRFLRGENANVEFGGCKKRLKSTAPRPLNAYVGLPPIFEDCREAKLFTCPSDQGGEDYPDKAKAIDKFGNSYNANPLLMGTGLDPRFAPEPWKTLYVAMDQTSKPLRHAAIKDPATLLFVGDHNWFTLWEPLNTFLQARDWHGRHHHHNFSFLDGHVDFVRIKKGLCLTDQYRINPAVEINGFVRQHQKSVGCACGRP